MHFVTKVFKKQSGNLFLKKNLKPNMFCFSALSSMMETVAECLWPVTSRAEFHNTQKQMFTETQSCENNKILKCSGEDVVKEFWNKLS